MIRRLALILFLATPIVATAQNPLLDQTIKSGAFAESVTTICSQKNPRGAQQYNAALAAWKQRNRWDAILPKATPGAYDEASATAVQALRKQGSKAIALCLDMNKTLSAFDPSRQYAQELAQLASGEGESPSNGTQFQPPTVTAQTTSPSPSASTVTQQAAPQPTAPPATTSPQQAPMATAAAGTRAQVGDASFVVPATWRVGKTTATGSLYQRPAKDRGSFTAFVLEQKPMQGDPKASFAMNVRGMFPGKTPELKYIYEAKTRTGLAAFQVRDGSQLMTGGRSKSVALRAVGVQLPGNQMFVILLISSDGYAGKSDAEKELGAVVSSLSFRSQNNGQPWDPLTNHGNGNATGVYWSSTITNMPNAFGGMDTRAERKYVVLLPGGRAYRDLPKGGHVTDMDFARVCSDAKAIQNCGSYDLQGGTVTFRWPSDFGLMSVSSGPYLAGKSLKNEGSEYYYIKPVSGDVRLNGRYTSFFASVGSTAFSSNSVSSEKSITFAPDGRYQKQGFSAASFTNSGAAGTFGGSKAPKQGTYQINGYELILKPSSGPPESYTVVFEEQSAHPKAVFIDDDGYLAK